MEIIKRNRNSPRTTPEAPAGMDLNQEVIVHGWHDLLTNAFKFPLSWLKGESQNQGGMGLCSA
ncbi:MAG: hypothetical protein QMD88_07000 [Coprothermobacterota bacterium]|nr:hypothetical protein [Coprothermobacterota bacterium]